MLDVSNNDSEIRQLEQRLLEAMRLKKLTFLNSIFSQKYVFLGSDGSTWGKDEALKDFRNPGYELSKIEVQNQQIYMHDNCAVVTGISMIEGKMGETSLTGRFLFMRVWNKENDGWKIIAVSTSKPGKIQEP